MGRNAKFLKKVKKPTTSQQSHKPATASTAAPTQQKKKAGLKAKAYRRKEGSEGHVLGDADYVQLMLGGRRKAAEEAVKLPQDSDS